MKKQKFDFGGWATKNDLLCADGRTIRKNAFKDDDGRTVPLVWQHNHEDPTRVIGHALLENRDEGVYAYGTFNDTDIAQHVKELVRHNDVCSLSIYANKLKQSGGDVLHGTIREVSVVLAGANPGAMIEFPIMEHGEESETEAVIWTGDEELVHGDGMSLSHEENSGEGEGKGESDGDKGEKSKDEKKAEEAKDDKKVDKEDEKDEDDEDDDEEEEVTVGDVLESMTEKQRAVTEQLVELALDGAKPGDIKHADDEEDEEDGETIGDVLETMTPEQKKVVEFLVAQAIAANEEGDEEDEEGASHSIEDNEEDTTMANVFEKNGPVNEQENGSLTHAQLMTLQDEMKKGTLKEAVLAHADEYGIVNIDYIMPEYREFSGNGAPQFIKRDTTWVNKVMQGVHHTPFAKVKTTFADIREDEARAKGYIKGNRKKEEVFALLKRETAPKTVYKKQKIDRDDAIDLSNGFDMVAWLKSEMRMMLDEELARAFIIGDGRSADKDDKIDEDKIRPVFKDDSLFVVRKELAAEQGQARADALVDAVTYAWEEYQGTGNCVAFMTRREHSGLKLLKDKMGRRIYNNDSEIASALGVREIIFLPQMGDDTTVREDSTSGKSYKPLVIILDLDDYNVGADKGGSVNMFDDFDIDYNQMKYLIETRCSGALVKPFSALVIEEEVNP